jgi:signal transduction histidine kinase
MKLIRILILLLFPLLAFGQSIDSLKYPIVHKAEKWIDRGHADSAYYFAKYLLSQPNLNALEKRQALFAQGKAGFESTISLDPVPLYECIQLAQKEQDELLLSKSLLTLSAVLFEIGESPTDSILYYLESAKTLAEKLQNREILASIHINIAANYFVQEFFDKSLRNNRIADSILLNTNYAYLKAVNSYGLANNLMELFYTTDNKAYLLEAKKKYEFAIDVYKNNNRKINEAHARNAIAGCLIYTEDLRGAEDQIKLSILTGQELGDLTLQLNGHYNLSNIYQLQNKYTDASDEMAQVNQLLDKTGHLGDAIFIKKQFSNNEIRVTKALVNNEAKVLDKQAALVQTKQWLLALGIAVCFALFWVYYQWHQNKLLQARLNNFSKTKEVEFVRAQLQAEEKSRLRIAQQIHDGVGGLLISTKWNLESALEEISGKEQKVITRLQENLRLQENSYLELRRVMYELQKDDAPWWETLQQFCQQMTQNKNIKIQFYTYDLDHNTAGTLGNEIRFAIQELVTNVLKHAQATELSIQISQIDGVLDVIVEDNGIGFDQQKAAKGLGLRGVKKRIEKIGGNLSIESTNSGTIAFVDVPVPPQESRQRFSSPYASAN